MCYLLFVSIRTNCIVRNAKYKQSFFKNSVTLDRNRKCLMNRFTDWVRGNCWFQSYHFDKNRFKITYCMLVGVAIETDEFTTSAKKKISTCNCVLVHEYTLRKAATLKMCVSFRFFVSFLFRSHSCCCRTIERFSTYFSTSQTDMHVYMYVWHVYGWLLLEMKTQWAKNEKKKIN